MSYPYTRLDFESGTIASAGLDDFSSQFSIQTTHAFTGTHGVIGGTNNNLFTTADDGHGGNCTISVYFYPTTTAGIGYIYARVTPTGTDANTWVRVSFLTTTGILIYQDVSGTSTALNTGLSGFTLPLNVWYCLTLNLNGTTLTASVVRQDTGQFFVNSGSGSWTSTPTYVTETTAVTGAGSWGIRGNIYGCVDDFIVDPVSTITDNPTFSISSPGGTQHLTAGGFTDPLATNPGGVTWASSNTGVATVGATTGLVTAVANGSVTITATGVRDTGQTATAAGTITGQGTAPTTATLSAASRSGTVGVVSGTFTITLDHAAQSGGVSCPITSSVGGDTITSSPIVIASGQTTGTFTITPSTVGSRNVTLGTTTPSLIIDGSPIAFTSTAAPTTATLSAASTSGDVGVASANFTITLDHPAPTGGVVCTITDSVSNSEIS